MTLRSSVCYKDLQSARYQIRTEKGRFCVTDPATIISCATPLLTRYLSAVRLFQIHLVATAANIRLQIEAIKVRSVVFVNQLQLYPPPPALFTALPHGAFCLLVHSLHIRFVSASCREACEI
jgi:hypothetical protein